MFILKNRLAECLAAKKINQSRLARRLFMSRAYVSRLMRGEIEPSIKAAFRIARYFGKPIEEIFELVEADRSNGTSSLNFPVTRPPKAGESNKLGGKQTAMKDESA
jgi:putative transcriptional regulator